MSGKRLYVPSPGTSYSSLRNQQFAEPLDLDAALREIAEWLRSGVECHGEARNAKTRRLLTILGAVRRRLAPAAEHGQSLQGSLQVLAHKGADAMAQGVYEPAALRAETADLAARWAEGSPEAQITVTLSPAVLHQRVSGPGALDLALQEAFAQAIEARGGALPTAEDYLVRYPQEGIAAVCGGKPLGGHNAVEGLRQILSSPEHADDLVRMEDQERREAWEEMLAARRAAGA